ncbi:MAG: dihydrofolate reductase family protein [Nocardioidaceae bacterium]
MGRLVVTEFISLDGVFDDPGGSEGTKNGGWTFTFDRGDDGDRFKLDELLAADAQLLGRVTYDGFAAAWPKIQDEVGFADKMNSMPKYVVSSTLREATWNNTTVIRGNVSEEVSALKRRHSGDLLIAGSGTLVRGLMASRLIDELRLMVFPIVLGEGRQLFGPATATTRMTLVESKPVGRDGVMVMTYALADKAAAGSTSSA